MSRLRSRRLIQAAVYGKGASGGGFTPSSTQSTNFLNRVAAVTGVGSPTYGLSTTERNAYDTMITGIVSDLGGNTSLATWPVFDFLYIFATASPAVAALNLISSSYPIIVHGSPTFNPDHGYTGIASAYLDTQFVPNVGTPNYVEDNASAWLWTLTNFASGTDYGPALQDGESEVRLYPQYSDNFFYSAINGGTNSYQPAAAGHFYGISRLNLAQTTYIDTTSQGFSGSSILVPKSSITLLGISGTPFTGNLAAAALGSSVTGTQQGFIYARFHKFMQDVAGAP